MIPKQSREIKRLLGIIGVLLLICVGLFVFEVYKNKDGILGQYGNNGQDQATRLDQESILGCYVATTPSDVRAGANGAPGATAKDVYTLNIQSQTLDTEQTTAEYDISNVSGTLAFKNFQKDSSSGTFTGLYSSRARLADASDAANGGDRNALGGYAEGNYSYAYDIEDTLFGQYTFQSEGATSVTQVIFKKAGNDFIRGYGEMNAAGDRFASLSDITYDASSTLAVFKKTVCPGV